MNNIINTIVNTFPIEVWIMIIFAIYHAYKLSIDGKFYRILIVALTVIAFFFERLYSFVSVF